MFLDKIRKIKQDELIQKMKPKKDILLEFQKNKINIIAEIKKASPSKGDINPDIDILSTAKSYIKEGAAAISVLTEGKYFKGSVEDFKKIRENLKDAVLLRKDFILDEYQIYESKVLGADIVLVIVALTGYEKSKELINLAHKLGLYVLLEVHNEEELKLALELNCYLIGINNRNLNTLDVTLDTSRALSKFITDDKIFISESGISSEKEIKELMNLGYRGFLIGSSLMKNSDPAKALNEIITKVDE